MLVFSIYVLALFFFLSPGILVTLPNGGSKMKVAAVHGLIFAVVLYFTGHFVWSWSNKLFEGYKEGKRGRSKKTAKKGEVKTTKPPP
jgi:hypothetical protein